MPCVVIKHEGERIWQEHRRASATGSPSIPRPSASASERA